MLILHLSRVQHQDLWGMVFVLAIILITSRWSRSGRRDGWRQAGEAMRARANQRHEEQRAFQDQMLSEMRRQSAATEAQNELLRQLVSQRAAVSESDSAAV